MSADQFGPVDPPTSFLATMLQLSVGFVGVGGLLILFSDDLVPLVPATLSWSLSAEILSDAVRISTSIGEVMLLLGAGTAVIWGAIMVLAYIVSNEPVKDE